MYSVVFIFIFVFILGMPVWVPSRLSLALSLCWWPCGWQCHGSPGKATGYSSERRRKKWSFHPHCATVLHSQFIQWQWLYTFHWLFSHSFLRFQQIDIRINIFIRLFSTARYTVSTCVTHLFEALRLGAGLGRAWPAHAVVQACAGGGKSCAVKPALRSRLKFSDIHIFMILYHIYYLNFLANVLVMSNHTQFFILGFHVFASWPIQSLWQAIRVELYATSMESTGAQLGFTCLTFRVDAVFLTVRTVLHRRALWLGLLHEV